MTSSRIWIGGGTGAGKTTTARALAVRYGLRRFSIDSFWYAYDARWAQPRKMPDEQWLETPPEVQAVEFEETSRRMMRYALDDLDAIADAPTVIEVHRSSPTSFRATTKPSSSTRRRSSSALSSRLDRCRRATLNARSRLGSSRIGCMRTGWPRSREGGVSRLS